jgi:CTP synthase (UTP-ammonia lyase)
MSARVRIALVGDYDPGVAAHVAIPKALAIAGRELDCRVEGAWVPTETLSSSVDGRLEAFNGLWCVPASPYKSMEGALAAIRFARETGPPFLSTPSWSTRETCWGITTRPTRRWIPLPPCR